ncbi:GtrA family protein [Sagittula sp.]|uniref:GtrA family protein n=1 Tax=Sagittula sp. TaxID=2038081 RepID=UPI00351862C3
MEVVRFFGVSLLGVIFDIAVAYALASHTGIPLWIAAALGFIAAAGVNYMLHEIWTFREGARRLSRVRAMKYLGASVATLLTRIAVVAVLEGMLDGRYPLAILICGAGVSFFVNFALSKIFVFSNPSLKAD